MDATEYRKQLAYAQGVPLSDVELCHACGRGSFVRPIDDGQASACHVISEDGRQTTCGAIYYYDGRLRRPVWDNSVAQMRRLLRDTACSVWALEQYADHARWDEDRWRAGQGPQVARLALEEIHYMRLFSVMQRLDKSRPCESEYRGVR